MLYFYYTLATHVPHLLPMDGCSPAMNERWEGEDPETVSEPSKRSPSGVEVDQTYQKI